MKRNTAPFLHLLVTIFLLIIAVFPSSTRSEDARYTTCSANLFHCGNFTSVGYPFWGNGRPDYCGHPGFELDCEDNNVTTMQMRDVKYYVKDIEPKMNLLKIARWDFRGNVCPDKYPLNTTLENTLFNYSSANEIATLFYNCSVANSSLLSEFICYNNNIGHRGYLNLNTSTELAKELALTCEVGVVVPILKMVIQALINHTLDVQAVLYEGFEIMHGIVGETECVDCNNSGGLCGYDTTRRNFACFCKNGAYPRSCHDQHAVSAEAPTPTSGYIPNKDVQFSLDLKLLIGLSVCILGVLFIGVICCCRRIVSSKKIILSWNRNRTNDKNVEVFIRQHGSLAPKRYSYSDIKKITSSMKDRLGQGGFGGVYKGKLLDGRLVAVKVLKESKGDGEEFINEVASISRTSHVNVVALLGFCFEGRRRALIYEFMPNGSLEKFIYGRSTSITNDKNLGWEKLYQIAIGIARGLEYLHLGCNTRILHFDIKPHNILLDEDFCPKIADFGLAKLCLGKESIISMLGARGTIGYIAPEVFNRNFGGVSHKSDVYSYGSMILEMVGGRKNINAGVSQSSEIYFPHWIYKRLELENDFILEGVTTEGENEIARKMVLVGLWCIQTDPLQRPSISKVIDMLGGSIEVLQIPPKPFLSSPPRSLANSSTPSTTSIL